MCSRPHYSVTLVLFLFMSSTLHSEQDSRTLVMAHRGGMGLWPENTLYGYRRALEAGVDVLEIDIWLTRDGVVVVNHDETVDRTTDGHGALRDFNLEELRQLDAGYRWTIDGAYPYRGEGHTVSTLDQVLAEIPEARFNIDIKENSDGLIDGLGELIAKHGASDRVLVASFHQTALYRFRKRYPDVKTSAGSREIVRFLLLSKLGLSSLLTPTYVALQLPMKAGPFNLVTQSLIDAAHNRDIEVHPFTVNSTDEMRRLVKMGIDGIITDYPDRLIEVLNEK